MVIWESVNMKTTLDIPDPLFVKIKIIAAQKRKPVRDILIHALRTIIENEENPKEAIPIEKFYGNTGWPILKSNSSKMVTEESINKIREKEGI